MARKTHDLCIKTGSYTDRNGQNKNRYQTVGALMMGDDGRAFVLLEAHFNPAGVDRQPGRSSIILSAFEPKQADGAADEAF